MKYFYSFLLIASTTLLSAQVPLSGSFTDCNNNTKDIHSTLGTGKAIIIAHKGVDCSICVSQAPSLQTWAANNKTNVEVWTALTWKFRGSTFSNMCASTNSWISTHSWTDIFTFPDSMRQFINPSTPRYYVYSPIDSTIAYNGTNRTTAYNTALQLSTVGLAETKLKKDIESRFYNGQLIIQNKSGNNVELNVYTLEGKLLFNTMLGSSLSIDLNSWNSKLLIFQYRNAETAYSEKVIVQN